MSNIGVFPSFCWLYVKERGVFVYLVFRKRSAAPVINSKKDSRCLPDREGAVFYCFLLLFLLLSYCSLVYGFLFYCFFLPNSCFMSQAASTPQMTTTSVHRMERGFSMLVSPKKMTVRMMAQAG